MIWNRTCVNSGCFATLLIPKRAWRIGLRQKRLGAHFEKTGWLEITGHCTCVLALFSLRTLIRVATILAPLHPIGWPKAILPPCTLTLKHMSRL